MSRNEMNGWRKAFLITAAAAVVVSVSGCRLGGGPRARWGFTPKEKYGDPQQLGTHSYGFGGSEGCGILYTLRGGSIDPDHIRGAADLTRYTYEKAYDAMMNKKSMFKAGPAFEMTTNKVQLDYPPTWDKITIAEKQKIAHEAALIIAPVISYNSTIWHEMLTWEGLHFALIEPEHESAFSWEDLYSNALGTQLAVNALRSGRLSTGEYNQAMTRLINEQLKELQAVSKQRALEIRETVRGSWFTDDKLMKRNMDIGFDDGLITPCIIPGFTDKPPVSISMPTFDGLDKYGIGVTYTISSFYLQNGTLKRMAGVSSAVQPLKDYPAIIKKIEQEAIQKYNYTIR